MSGELDAVLEGLSDAERRALRAAFAADPELARGLAIMVDGLPRRVTEPVMRRLSVHLGRLGLGGGALVAALSDAIYQRLEHDNENERR